MPDDAPDASQLAVLQALCSSPNCLAALQVTLSAGLPRWADPILSAITQLLDGQELDLQLLAVVLLRLENLAMQQQQVASPQPSGHPKVPSGPETAADDVDDTAGQQQQQQQLPDPSVDLTDGTGAALQGAIPPEVQTAMQVCFLSWFRTGVPCITTIPNEINPPYTSRPFLYTLLHDPTTCCAFCSSHCQISTQVCNLPCVTALLGDFVSVSRSAASAVSSQARA